MKKIFKTLMSGLLLVSMLSGYACGSTADSDKNDDGGNENKPPVEKFEYLKLENESDYEKVFYVANQGDDNNAGTWDAPFKTIAKAKEAVAEVNDNMRKDIAVVMRKGTYKQTATLTFGVDDSGTNGHDIVYMAYPDEAVSVSGGLNLGKWEKVEGENYYATSVGGSSIRDLYINGNRASLARFPNGNQYSEICDWDDDKDQILVKTADLKGATAFETVLYLEWAEVVARVDSVTKNGDTAKLNFKAWDNKYLFERGFHPVQIRDDMPVYFQNAKEFLDAPGEFYFSKEDSKLYYYPREGENMEEVEAVVPVVDSVFRFEGTMRRDKVRVKNIVLDGLTIEHTYNQKFNKYGYMEDQSGHVAISQISGTYMGYDVPSGAIHVLNAKDIDVRNCIVRHAGGMGINYYSAASNCEVVGNYITDIASSGIITAPFINGIITDQNLYTPSEDEVTVNNILIKDNFVTWTGIVHTRGSAVANMLGHHIRIESNEIAWNNYTGISNGWGWSLYDFACHDNIITKNDIHHIGLNGSDLGGIYNLNNQKGTKIMNNYVHELQSTGMGASDGSPADGIYLDECSNNLVVTGNQVAHAHEDVRLIYYHQPGENNHVENNKGLLCGDTLDQNVIANAGLTDGYKNVNPYTVMGNQAIEYYYAGMQSNAEDGLFGYAVEMQEDTTLKGLGRFYTIGNVGKHKLAIYEKTESGVKEIASGTLQAKGDIDEFGFEYVMFETPVTLEKGKTYYILGEEKAGGDIHMAMNTKMILNGAFKILGGLKGKDSVQLNTKVNMYGAYVPFI